MKRHKHLWELVCSFENVAAAAREAVLGKRGKGAGARFFAEWEREVVRLEIHPDKYRSVRCADGADFCGIVVRADGRVKMRESGVRRFKRRYRKLRREAKRGRVPMADVTRSVRAWVAHAAHAQSWRLRGAVLSV